MAVVVRLHPLINPLLLTATLLLQTSSTSGLSSNCITWCSAAYLLPSCGLKLRCAIVDLPLATSPAITECYCQGLEE
jgi:hypothetical protein